MEQRTNDWYNARCGKITASSMWKVLSSPKLAVYKNYLAEIVAEQITGTPAESYTNTAMQWGIDNEELARLGYELETGIPVTEVGFLQHESMLVGASPDGLAGKDGLIEIKCPNTATHIDTLLTNNIDNKYITQMQCQMWITGRAWCDFVSYDPRLTGKSQMKIIRVERDNWLINEIELESKAFLDKVDQIVKRIEEINGV